MTEMLANTNFFYEGMVPFKGFETHNRQLKICQLKAKQTHLPICHIIILFKYHNHEKN